MHQSKGVQLATAAAHNVINYKARLILMPCTPKLWCAARLDKVTKRTAYRVILRITRKTAVRFKIVLGLRDFKRKISWSHDDDFSLTSLHGMVHRNTKRFRCWTIPRRFAFRQAPCMGFLRECFIRPCGQRRNIWRFAPYGLADDTANRYTVVRSLAHCVAMRTE